MTVGAQGLMHRFHQTPLSRTIRKVPGARAIAMRWWLRSQGWVFKSAISGVAAPTTPFDESQPRADVPSLKQLRDRDARTVELGDAFSSDMAEWCSTSKFQSLGYQDVYGRVLSHLRSSSPRVLEVGIGVNDPNAPSGMQAGHRPGASLVGWANYFPGSQVHGADIDRRVLFDTELYSTHWVDQRDPASLQALAEEVGAPLDLVVDDGLHTAEANALTASALLPYLSPQGVLVIEDILPEYDDLWSRAGGWLRPEYMLAFYPGSALRGGRGEGLAVFRRRA